MKNLDDLHADGGIPTEDHNKKEDSYLLKIEHEINEYTEAMEMLIKDFNSLYSISTALIDGNIMTLDEAVLMFKKQMSVINNNMKLKHYPFKYNGATTL